MFNIIFFKKQKVDEKDNSKSQFYLVIFCLMLLFALILSIGRLFNHHDVSNKENEEDINQNTSEINNKETETEEQSNLEILGNKDDLISFSVQPGDVITGVLNFSGSVKNAYFFEGNILINILDSHKNVIFKSYANATTDWITSEPVEFKGNIDLSKFSSGRYYLEIHNDNASGLKENDKSILIPIHIGENSEFLKIEENCYNEISSKNTGKYLSFKDCLYKNGVPSWP